MTEVPPGGAEPHPPLALNRAQRRVLGVLVEKAFCTPENYPLTANALLAGCNQKSNRDPVTELLPHVVDECLLELQKLGLAIRVMPASGRTERWKHAVKEYWQLDRPQRAVLAELLLRGAQTEGELRGRASRMVEIASLEELANILDQLTQRQFVRRLTPPGQKRGVTWTHLLASDEELSRIQDAVALRASESPEESPAESRSRPTPSFDLTDRLTRLETELDRLRAALEASNDRIDALRTLIEDLQGRLG